MSTLTGREKTEGRNVFFSGTEDDSSASWVAERAWGMVWSASDISQTNIVGCTGWGESVGCRVVCKRTCSLVGLRKGEMSRDGEVMRSGATLPKSLKDHRTEVGHREDKCD